MMIDHVQKERHEFTQKQNTLSASFVGNDRIAVITWQYGKFPPTLPHGWLEPSYTGVVKGIALTYTKILSDSEALLKIPNALVTQSLILNLSHSKQGHVGTQFEVPIRVDPDELHKELVSRLSKNEEFRGEKQSFEVIEVSSVSYLVTVIYGVDKGREKEMKSLMFKTIRLALLDCSEKRGSASKSVYGSLLCM
ncbi:MAG: mechanosensitive ion channel family protein [Candidatus Bathyarchaeia archaeon]